MTTDICPVTGINAAKIIAAIDVTKMFNGQAEVMLRWSAETHGVLVQSGRLLCQLDVYNAGQTVFSIKGRDTQSNGTATLLSSGLITCEWKSLSRNTYYWRPKPFRHPKVAAEIRWIAGRVLPVITPLLPV